MGRTETFFTQCHPEKVNETIKIYESFGWSVIGTQQITDDKGVDNLNYRHYETYTKITFSRDYDIPNKATLKELQDKYDNLIETARKNANPYYPSFPGKSLFAMILSIIVTCFGIKNGWPVAVFLIGVAVCSLWFILAYRGYKNDKKTYDSRISTRNNCLAEAENILKKAEKYL